MFEWDNNKNKANQEKHGVSFELGKKPSLCKTVDI